MEQMQQMEQVSPALTQHPCVSQLPNFSQSLDKTRPHVMLDARTPALRKQNRWSGNLVYRYQDTGETVIVPNIWYNQPVAWRVKATRWQAQRAREHLAQLEAEGVRPPVPGRIHFFSPEEARQSEMRTCRADIERLEELAATMERTGVVTC